MSDKKDELHPAIAGMLSGKNKETWHLLSRLESFNDQMERESAIPPRTVPSIELAQYLVKHGWRYSGSTPERSGKVDGLMDAIAIIDKHGWERGLRVILRYVQLIEKRINK